MGWDGMGWDEREKGWQASAMPLHPAGFVAASTNIEGTIPTDKNQPVAASNPDAIDIDGMEDD